MAIDTLGANALASNSVTTAKIADDAVTGAKIENNPTIAGNLGVNGITTSTGTIVASSGVAIGGTGTANTLDDYEEGTWTATLAGSTTNPTTPVTTTQKYIKIGHQVTIEVKFTNVNTTGAAGGIRVTGLPYPCDSNVAAAGGIMIYSRFTFATGHLAAYIPGSTLQVYNSRTGAAWTTANHSAGTGFYFWGTFVYYTDS